MIVLMAGILMRSTEHVLKCVASAVMELLGLLVLFVSLVCILASPAKSIILVALPVQPAI